MTDKESMKPNKPSE